mgnify:CR=1 FL=1
MKFPEEAVAEALSNRFCQSYFLDSYSFANSLDQKRAFGGATYFDKEEALELLDKEGLVRPLFRLNLGRTEGGEVPSVLISRETLASFLKQGLIEFPKPNDHVNWDTFGQGFLRSTMLFYHPAQAYFVYESFRHLLCHIPATSIKQISKEYTDAIMEEYNIYKTKYSLEANESKRKLLSLLILLENPYEPLLTGLKPNLFNPFTPNEWHNWKKAFNPQDLLSKCQLSAEEVVKWRDILAIETRYFDPLQRWFLLIQTFNLHKVNQLKGLASLAQDFYHYVKLLNLYIEALTGEKQPDPDQMGGNRNWRERIYGKDFDLGKESTRKKIVEGYSYPYVLFSRVNIIVEGPSEFLCIRLLADAIGWSLDIGTDMTNLEGVGGVKKLEPLLKTLKEMDIKPYLILDPHDVVNKTIPKLVGASLLASDCYRIWKLGFEEDNFSELDIIRRCNEMLQRRGIAITEDDVKLYGAQSEPITETISKILKLKHQASFDDLISKTELTRKLMEDRLNEISVEIKGGKYDPKLEIEKCLTEIRKQFLIYHI